MPRPSASVRIDAPLHVVWEVMLDTEAYGEWNPFVHRMECPVPAAEGDPVVLHVRWRDGRTSRSPERITRLDPPRAEARGGATSARLTYVYEGLPHRLGLVHSTRHQTLRQVAGGPTEYDTVQDLTGPLARLAGPARITDGFERHARALKDRAESLARR